MRGGFGVLAAAGVPGLLFVNKSHIAYPLVLGQLYPPEKHCLLVSAKTGEWLADLLDLLETEVPHP